MPTEIANIPAPRPSAPPAAWLVATELLRGLGGALLLPWRGLQQWSRRGRLLAEVEGDLAREAVLAPEDGSLALPARPLRLFVSCAEASGEIHACNLVVALRALAEEAGAPEPELVGLGGERLAALGVRTLGDPVSEARMGFAGVVGALPFYLELVHSAAAELRSGAVDLFVGVDSPALHVPLARVARRCGVPTVQYITPQYWGWAPWRAAGFRRAVDLALSILPFEPAWFARRGIDVAHVGHPLLDELEESPRRRPPAEGPRTLALLPGSRRSVVERNLPIMLSLLEDALGADDSWRVAVCAANERLRPAIEAAVAASSLGPERLGVEDDLEALLARSEGALSVSGTILIHLLHRRLPAVVLYALENRLQAWLGRRFLTVPWFSSVNLLAGRSVYPEFSFAGGAPPPACGAAVERLLGDAAWREHCRGELEAAAGRLGPAGASRRAARAVLGQVSAHSA